MNKSDQARRILVVDDEKYIRKFVQELLYREGYHTDEAEDGEQCLEKIKTYDPHVILLDYMMPKMNGMEVVKHMTANTIQIPTIIITGRGGEMLAVNMLKEGAFDYITKPFKSEDLFRSVKNALTIGKASFSSLQHEFLLLKNENSFLREQVTFMQKVMKMDSEGDIALDTLNKELLDLDITKLPRDSEILDEKIKDFRSFTLRDNLDDEMANDAE